MKNTQPRPDRIPYSVYKPHIRPEQVVFQLIACKLGERIIIPICWNACSNIGAPMYEPSSDVAVRRWVF